MYTHTHTFQECFEVGIYEANALKMCNALNCVSIKSEQTL